MTWLIPTRLFLPRLALLAGAVLAEPVGLACAQQPPANPPKPAASPTEELLRKAIEASGKEDLDEANKQIDAALKLSPDDRQVLFLSTIFATMGVDKAPTAARKVTLLRRSTASYHRLAERHKPLQPQEEGLSEMIALNDARILAIEGKTEPALRAIAQLVAGGYANFEAIDEIDDFKAVRALPDYQAKLDQASVTGIKMALKEARPFSFDFTLKDVDGKPVKLADVRGQVTIVDVWGTWCPPCREEIPHFVALLDKYEAKGLKIVGVNCNEEGSPAEVKKTINDFKTANKMKYPCLLNDDTTEEKIPDFKGYPTTLFLDRAGKVRLVLVGYTPMSRLEAIVTTLLAEPKS